MQAGVRCAGIPPEKRNDQAGVFIGSLPNGEGAILMMYTSMTELIGHTPLLELRRYAKNAGVSGILAAKLEMFNPAGSAKDRVAAAMIRDAEENGSWPRAARLSSLPAATRASAWRRWRVRRAIM